MKLFSKYGIRRRISKGLPDSDLLPTLISQWYQSPQGAAVLKAEKDIVSPILARLFGYHILQVGLNEEVSLIDESPAGHKIIFAPSWHPDTRHAVADIEELPLATDSIDVVVVHHALDFTEDSHRLLREVTRVLRSGGQMLIIGFNPLSYWGFWRLFKRKIYIPWRGRFISKRRLSDWLQLLNLQIGSIYYGLHFLPIKYVGLGKLAQKFEKVGRKLRIPLGGAYFIMCEKRVAPLNPIVLKWRPLNAPVTVIPAAENVSVKID